MSSKIDYINNLVKTYRLNICPTLVGAKILINQYGSDFVKILSNWSQKNLEANEVVKFQRHHVISLSTFNPLFDLMPVDTSQITLSSYSKTEKFICSVKEVKQDNKKKQFIEIWNEGALYKNFNVEAFNVHGDIYCDGKFGSLEWSSNEDKVLYIAERKIIKNLPFYKQTSDDADNGQQDCKKDFNMGNEYLFREDWGEQLVNKHQPVIGICDLTTETLNVLSGVPPNFSPGEVLWSKDDISIFGVVFENEPRRLGLLHCTNRTSYIFQLSLNGEFKILSDKNKSVHSPRLSLDGKNIFWLQREVGGAHDGCHELIKLDLISNEKKVLIGMVQSGTSTFSGLYLGKLPSRCLSNDGKKLFFSSLNNLKIMSYCIDLETTKIHSLNTGEGSSTVLDVYDDFVVISNSSLMQSSCLKLSKTPINNLDKLDKLEWISVTTSHIFCKDAIIKEMEYESTNTQQNFRTYNGLYYGPTNHPGKKIPLIVYPHGGPHSASFNGFSFVYNFFVSLGYGILAVNYRGSIGTGQEGVEFLRGKIGETDVKDVHEAVLAVLTNLPYLDQNNVFLFGGSHGGFLVSHLSAQYPNFYRAVVNANGVSDVSVMYSLSDIPDWASAESGFEFDETKPMTVEEAVKMIEASPIYISHKIKVPTFIVVGTKDRRVPHYQGLKLYNALKARGVKVRLNVYDDNHSLDTVPVHIDFIINAALWFHENTK